MDVTPESVDNSTLIAELKEALRQKLRDFDRWLTENPQANPADDLTFRARRHEIKLLRLRLAELQAMDERYVEDSLLMRGQPIANPPQISRPRQGPATVTSSRGIKVSDTRRRIKIADNRKGGFNWDAAQ